MRYKIYHVREVSPTPVEDVKGFHTPKSGMDFIWLKEKNSYCIYEATLKCLVNWASLYSNYLENINKWSGIGILWEEHAPENTVFISLKQAKKIVVILNKLNDITVPF